MAIGQKKLENVGICWIRAKLFTGLTDKLMYNTVP